MEKEGLKIVVSIDGGGIRGIFPLLVLHHLKELLKKEGITNDLSASIDLIAGTSTGAIISAGFIARENGKPLYSIEELLNLYATRGLQLFNLTNPGHEESEGLKLLLKRKFKGITLSDIATPFAFVSFDMRTKRPFVFGNNQNTSLSHLPIDIALAACSAVPGYFPPVKINDLELVDGIIAAKNPAKIALFYARKYFPNHRVILISLGTGQMTGEMLDEIEEEVENVHLSLKKEAKSEKGMSYYRFQPAIKTADQRMDNAKPENIKALKRDGEKFIQEKEHLFQQLIREWKEA